MKANLIFAGLLVVLVWGGTAALAGVLAHSDQITVMRALEGRQ